MFFTISFVVVVVVVVVLNFSKHVKLIVKSECLFENIT